MVVAKLFYKTNVILMRDRVRAALEPDRLHFTTWL